MAHQFETASFSSPTDCANCGKLLIGLFNQGEKCKLCSVATHKGSCARRLMSESRCHCAPGGLGTGPSLLDDVRPSLLDDVDGEFEGSSLLSHSFQAKTFTKPTDCAVCGKLLLGVVKQGVACESCGIACHKNCTSRANSSLQCSGFSREENLGPVMDSGIVAAPRSPRKAMLEVDDSERGSDFLGMDYGDPTANKSSSSNPLENLIDVDAISRDLGQFQMSASSKLSELGSSFKGTIDKWDTEIEQWTNAKREEVERALDDADKRIDQTVVDYTEKTQAAVARVEKDGVANTVVRGIKSGTGALVRGMSNLADKLEKEVDKGEQVAVDKETRETVQAVKQAAETVHAKVGDATEIINEATQRGLTRLSETETAKQLKEETDPETRKFMAESLAGVGAVVNEAFNSLAEIGAAAGKSTVRASGHLYGDQVQEVTAESVGAAGDVIQSYWAVSGAVTGTSLLRAPVRTAEGWASREPTVLEGCMYAKTYEMLGMQDLVLTKLDKAKKELSAATAAASAKASQISEDANRLAADNMQELETQASGFIREHLGPQDYAIRDNHESKPDSAPVRLVTRKDAQHPPPPPLPKSSQPARRPPAPLRASVEAEIIDDGDDLEYHYQGSANEFQL